MKYIKKDNGEIVTAKSVRKAARNVFLPKDESKWSKNTLSLLGVEPVYNTKPPSVNPKKQRAVQDGVERVEGRWQTRWKVVPRFSSVKQARDSIARQVSKHAEELSKGVLNVGGIFVKTDGYSLGRLMAAKASSKGGSRKFVDKKGKTHNLSKQQVDDLLDSVDNFLQQIDDRHAQLIDEIESSTDPLDVNIQEGWPDGAA